MALTDEQLRDRLTSLGCDVGPIDDTTRPLYVSLLKRREADGRSKSSAKPAKKSSPRVSSTVETPSAISPKPSARPAVRSPDGVSEKIAASDGTGAPAAKATARSNAQTTNRRPVDSSSPKSANVNSTMYAASPSASEGRNLFSIGISPVRPEMPISPAPRVEKPYVITPRNKYARRPLYAPNYSHTAGSSNGFSDDENDHRGNASNSHNSSHSRSSIATQNALYRTYSRESPRHKHVNATGENPPPSHIISKVLFGSSALVFIALAVAYYRLGTRSEDSAGSLWAEPKTSFEACKQGQSSGDECVREDVVPLALNVKNRLTEALVELNHRSVCGGSSQESQSTENCVGYDSIRAMANTDEDVFNGVLHLIGMNKHWGLLVDRGNIESCVLLASYSPPLSCRAMNVMRQMLTQLCILAGVLAFIYVAYWLYERNKRRIRERKRLINGYVEDITDLLSNNAIDNPETPYLAILEIRNKLLQGSPTSSRANKLWKEVEAKFEATESSRVSREKQRIRGEWFVVWRWLPPPTSSGSGNEKVWQGKAFDGLTGAKPMTQCLKIKNMFCLTQEQGDDWVEEVRRAIIKKCGESHKIVHMHVAHDSPEGIVYAKMESLEAAGDVHKKLHGSWFSGRLVTAKYLTEERYHQKFPDSVNCKEAIVA